MSSKTPPQPNDPLEGKDIYALMVSQPAQAEPPKPEALKPEPPKSEVPPDTTGTKQGDVRTFPDGERILAEGGNWIKYTKLPSVQDYEGMLRLLGAFEMRFMKAVRFGLEVDEKAYDSIKELFDGHNKVYTKELLKTHGTKTFRQLMESFGKVPFDEITMNRFCRADIGNMEELYPRYNKDNLLDTPLDKIPNLLIEDPQNPHGGQLAVAGVKAGIFMFRRMIEAKKGGLTTMELLRADLEHGNKLLSLNKVRRYCRRAHTGEIDRDDVLGEMCTEPFNIASPALIGPGPGDTMLAKRFAANRYNKISRGWQNIDAITEALVELVGKSRALSQVTVTSYAPDSYLVKISMCDAIRQIAANAKTRSENMRYDSTEGLAGVADRLNNVSNVFLAAGAHLAQLEQQVKDRTTISFRGQRGESTNPYRGAESTNRVFTDALDLLHDLAHIRVGRPRTTELMIDRIKTLGAIYDRGGI